MSTLRWLVAVVTLLALGAGCKKKPEDVKPAKPGPSQPSEPTPGALPEDKAYLAPGKVEAVALEVQTRLDMPNLGPEGPVDDDVKRAQEGSALMQKLVVSDDRGKLVFTTKDFYIPLQTELRYNPAHKRYVLADPKKKTYWAMSGSELGNLLEGGPTMTRTRYSIAITDTEEKETIAGVETRRTNADLAFHWSMKTKQGQRKGQVKVKLSIWHGADPKLKAAWGGMMVDFLTVPFQDAEGQKIVDDLKRRVKFPLKWAMEVQNEGQAREKGEATPNLLSTTQKLEVVQLERRELASPPPGYSPATAPYEFGEGGQTVHEDLLGKLPAKPGPPPKNVEPPETPDEKTQP